MTKTRPTGVTILAVLNIIGGALSLLGGVTALFLGGLATVGGAAQGNADAATVGIIASPGFSQPEGRPQGNADAATVGIIAVVTAVILLITGALSLVVAYGLWNLLGWAWITAVVLQIIGLVMNALNLFQGSGGAVFSIAIAAVVLYYLYQPNVKAAFGKT